MLRQQQHSPQSVRLVLPSLSVSRLSGQAVHDWLCPPGLQKPRGQGAENVVVTVDDSAVVTQPFPGWCTHALAL